MGRIVVIIDANYSDHIAILCENFARSYLHNLHLPLPAPHVFLQLVQLRLLCHILHDIRHVECTDLLSQSAVDAFCLPSLLTTFMVMTGKTTCKHIVASGYLISLSRFTLSKFTYIIIRVTVPITESFLQH